jgi:hypothetical protein
MNRNRDAVCDAGIEEVNEFNHQLLLNAEFGNFRLLLEEADLSRLLYVGILRTTSDECLERYSW